MTQQAIALPMRNPSLEPSAAASQQLYTTASRAAPAVVSTAVWCISQAAAPSSNPTHGGWRSLCLWTLRVTTTGSSRTRGKASKYWSSGWYCRLMSPKGWVAGFSVMGSVYPKHVPRAANDLPTHQKVPPQLGTAAAWLGWVAWDQSGWQSRLHADGHVLACKVACTLADSHKQKTLVLLMEARR